jgi:hypothetical protein
MNYQNHLYTEYYLVQKCSIADGGPDDVPHQLDPPKDYRSVFRKRLEAEAVCYQSAHAYAHACHAVVRTHLLPTGCNAHQVAGKLFWVRRVLVENNHHHHSMGVGGTTTTTAGAHVILINGVIRGRGGTVIPTGNHHHQGSLPSPDSETDCVFVGSDSLAKAHHFVMRHHHGASVAWLPVGSYTKMMDGWSNNSLLLEENMYHGSDASSTENGALLHSKRTGTVASLQEHQQNHYRASAPRPAKRACGSNRDSFTPSVVGGAESVDHHLYAASYMM